MKITLELEVGPETGIVAGALESQLKMLHKASELGRPIPMLIEATQKVLSELEEKIDQAMYFSANESRPDNHPDHDLPNYP